MRVSPLHTSAFPSGRQRPRFGSWRPVAFSGMVRRRGSKKVETLSDVDWKRWQPRDRATLLFVVRRGEILLIDKKRGLGAGKVNGPGGRLEGGETPLGAAIREVEEELSVTPIEIREMGELSFQFTDGYSLFATVYRANDCIGEARESDEAVPRWTPLTSIPYDLMWADDRLWLPLLLQGQRFCGRFLFSGDTMLDYQLLEL